MKEGAGRSKWRHLLQHSAIAHAALSTMDCIFSESKRDLFRIWPEITILNYEKVNLLLRESTFRVIHLAIAAFLNAFLSLIEMMFTVLYVEKTRTFLHSKGSFVYSYNLPRPQKRSMSPKILSIEGHMVCTALGMYGQQCWKNWIIVTLSKIASIRAKR